MNDDRQPDESPECMSAPDEEGSKYPGDTRAYAYVREIAWDVAFSRAQVLLDALKNPGESPAAAMTEEEMSRTLRDGMVAAALLGRRLRT